MAREPDSTTEIPLPPLEFRQLVGPTDSEAFDNPSGQPIYAEHGLPLEVYDTVFDFGCGCGREARRLLQQSPRPRRYIGIDVHKGMIEWCQQNLTPLDANFQFFHHDVYAPSYAPENTLQLSQPFPVGDGEFSLIVAHSIFTHLYQGQAQYYLSEVARILKPEGGVAFTSWFFFDNDSFPFLREGPFSLYTSEIDPTQAVIYDRRWFLEAVRRVGLGVDSTRLPVVAGHQWITFLRKRMPDMVDRFPLGEEGAQWLCGASLKPIAATAVSEEQTNKNKIPSGSQASSGAPQQPPALFGRLAEIAALKEAAAPEHSRAVAELAAIKRSWTWRVGRLVTAPLRVLRRFLRRR